MKSQPRRPGGSRCGGPSRPVVGYLSLRRRPFRRELAGSGAVSPQCRHWLASAFHRDGVVGFIVVCVTANWRRIGA